MGGSEAGKRTWQTQADSVTFNFSKYPLTKYINQIAINPPASPETKAVLNTGTTGHYLLCNHYIVNQCPTNTPVYVQLLNGKTITQTHPCKLPLSFLPITPRQAHLFPDLANHSLISIGVLCVHSCTALFDVKKVPIIHNGATVLTGARDHNGLWAAHLQPAPSTINPLNFSTIIQPTPSLVLGNTNSVLETKWSLT